MNNIGERIKKHRETKNMSQQDLSSAAGVSLGLIQQIEQGRHNNPSIKVLEKIAEILDIEVIHLIKDGVEAHLPKNKIEELKQRAKLLYVPVFDDIPTDDDVKLKSLSKVNAIIPIINNRADYILHLTKKYNLRAIVRPNDYVAIRKVKSLKNKNLYIFKINDKEYHVGLCTIYDGGKAFFRSQSMSDAPIEYNKKNITVIGELVGWLKNPINDSLPDHKINL